MPCEQRARNIIMCYYSMFIIHNLFHENNNKKKLFKRIRSKRKNSKILIRKCVVSVINTGYIIRHI